MAVATCTADDLGWFDSKNYLPQRVRLLDLIDWENIIGWRLVIQRSVVNGDLAEAQLHFLKIKTAPLSVLGGVRQHYRPDSLDTPSVRSLRLGSLRDLAADSSADKAEAWQRYDDTSSARGKFPYRPYLHLQVDLAASKAALLQDFDRFISQAKGRHALAPSVRDYRSLTRTWADFDYLPYFDLILFAKAFQRKITNAQIGALLGLETSDGEVEDRLKSARKSLKLFNEGTLQAIRAQIDREAMASGE